MEITNKRQFFDMWRLGVLGNRLRVFNTVGEAILAGCVNVGFRELNTQGGGGAFAEAYGPHAMMQTAELWYSLGRKYVICESAPDSQAVLQGELCQTYRGWEGYLAVNPWGQGVRMRTALNRGDMTAMVGLRVRDLMRRYIDPASLEDIDALFELYPDAAIEFTSYACRVGSIPGRSTIIWEVRNY